MSVHGQGQAPPAGWYPDPRDPRSLRYWTGTQWADPTAPTVAGSAPSVRYDTTRKSSTTAWVVVAAVLGGLVLIGILAAVAIPIFLDQREEAADASSESADADPSDEADPGGSGIADADAAARSDASTLAMAIATWYVDNDGPAPAVVVSGGQYLVDGSPVGQVSPGVTLGGVTGTGELDWCVWVTNPEGDLKDHEYSAALGLQTGTC